MKSCGRILKALFCCKVVFSFITVFPFFLFFFSPPFFLNLVLFLLETGLSCVMNRTKQLALR